MLSANRTTTLDFCTEEKVKERNNQLAADSFVYRLRENTNQEKVKSEFSLSQILFNYTVQAGCNGKGRLQKNRTKLEDKRSEK